MILFLFLILGMFLSLVIQHFIPPLPWMEGARVMLMPLVFFYGAVAMPYPVMLLMSLIAGVMWDGLNTQLLEGGAEISLGWSVVLYAVTGSIMSGFRPLFRKGRWEVHCLVSGIFTSLMVLSEYLMITFRRGDFIFTPEVWWRIGGPGLVATLLAPIVFFLFHSVRRKARFEPRDEEEGGL